METQVTQLIGIRKFMLNSLGPHVESTDTSIASQLEIAAAADIQIEAALE